MRSAEGPALPGPMSRATDTECLSGPSRVEPSERPSEALSLSIAASGDKQTATFQPIALSTTSTETNSTTDLKTCASCGATTTGTSTTGTLSTRQKTSADGVSGTQNTKQSTPSKSDSDGNASGPVGRFPPNLLLAHTPECVKVGTRQIKSGVAGPKSAGFQDGFVGGKVATWRQSAAVTFNGADGTETVEAWACAESCAVAELDRQKEGASRFFPVFRYEPKASRKERERGCEDLPVKTGAEAVDREEGSAGVQNPRAGAGRTAKEVRCHHPTVKPVALMRWLCRLVTPPGGIVLDPFVGSGTTGIACVEEGLRFIGIEREREYLDIAEARIGAAKGAK